MFKIDGAEAFRIGLVIELVQLHELRTRVRELGEESAAQPRQAVMSMLEVVVGHASRTLTESLDDETKAVAANGDSADAREGMRAFMEKRKPVFNQS